MPRSNLCDVVVWQGANRRASFVDQDPIRSESEVEVVESVLTTVLREIGFVDGNDMQEESALGVCLVARLFDIGQPILVKVDIELGADDGIARCERTVECVEACVEVVACFPIHTAVPCPLADPESVDWVLRHRHSCNTRSPESVHGVPLRDLKVVKTQRARFCGQVISIGWYRVQEEPL